MNGACMLFEFSRLGWGHSILDKGLSCPFPSQLLCLPWMKLSSMGFMASLCGNPWQWKSAAAFGGSLQWDSVAGGKDQGGSW